jgi:hypothetical protein
MASAAPTSADACLSIVHSLMCHRYIQTQLLAILAPIFVDIWIQASVSDPYSFDTDPDPAF